MWEELRCSRRRCAGRTELLYTFRCNVVAEELVVGLSVVLFYKETRRALERLWRAGFDEEGTSFLECIFQGAFRGPPLRRSCVNRYTEANDR